MAEVLFRKKALGPFLRMLGGIYVDRDMQNCSCLSKSLDILYHGGVVGIFPEGRLPLPQEERPIAFRDGAAYLAIQSGVKVIPVYTNGSYFNKRRARVVIGTPIQLEQADVKSVDDKAALDKISKIFRSKILELEKINEEREHN